MYQKPLFSLYLFVFSLFLLQFFSGSSNGQSFLPPNTAPAPVESSTNSIVRLNLSNPVIVQSNRGCAADNLRGERFANGYSSGERLRICQALDRLTGKLNTTIWSPPLREELEEIWKVLSDQKVDFRPMAPHISKKIIAAAQAFPDKTAAADFAGAIYLRPEKSDDPAFFQTTLHELRHLLDFYETWKNRTTLSSMEIERRAYTLVGKLTMETPEHEKFSGIPKFWKESWRKLSAAEIVAKRERAIAKFLGSKKFYREMSSDPNRRNLDFSFLKSTVVADNPPFEIKNERKNGVALPLHNRLPETVAYISQNIRESELELEKPINPNDDKEILRAALKNEKKLYYGMGNFVYDQNVNLQCLKKGKVSASLIENNTIARAADGNALFKLTAAETPLPCVVNYSNLKTDFTNTFWASPALDGMPIYFNRFETIDGLRLAVYTVPEPDERLFARLEAEYVNIRPFRVPVGTIYISPEDGQIVRFSGTSYPEETVTGVYAKRVRCTYWVKAVRQKLNLEKGIWVTVHVGSVAVANVNGKIRPFQYTVKFDNYRQSKTETKILEDGDESEAVAENSAERE